MVVCWELDWGAQDDSGVFVRGGWLNGKVRRLSTRLTARIELRCYN